MDFFFEKFTLPQFVDLNATATFTSLALPTENLSPINLLKTSTPFIYVTKPPTSIVYPTITKTPYVTSTATSTLEPVSLILKTDGAVYKFAVVNLPPECIPSICEVRWQNFEGAWIDNKKENGPQQNSFTNLKYDSNWKKAFTANLELEIDINPKNPYIIIFKACIDELKTKCFTASAGNPN